MSQQVLRTLLDSARYEILPTPGIVDDVCAHVPIGREISVTASVGLSLEATLSTAELLSAHGYPAVPHLAARLVRDRAQLTEIVDRLSTAGIERVFVPAGDAPMPAGRYSSALELLADLREMSAPLDRIGITGYPESHPLISDRATVQAMADKSGYATEVVSNLCFDPWVLAWWVHAVRTRGIALPIVLGVAGKVELAKLARVATRIGVGESTRFLRSHTATFAKMARPGGYNPRKFLDRMAPVLDDPAAGVAGLHVYTFNQIRATEEWRSRQLHRLEPLDVAG